MKIKNVLFSGFAAAMFAGVCGAANAAAVSLISKEYADTNLQAKLTAGDGIAISEDGKTTYEYNWESAYDGVRSVSTWME